MAIAKRKPAPIVLPNIELRQYQWRLWEALEGGCRRAIAVWHRRCLAEGTLVSMADGSQKPIELIRTGDIVLSWDGRGLVADEVTGHYPGVEREVLTVRMSGSAPIEATADHPFMTMSTEGVIRGWRPLRDVVGNSGMLAMQAARGIQGKAADGDLAEFLGYMLTDGSVNPEQSPKFTNTNYGLIERVAGLSVAIFAAVPRVRAKGNGWDCHLSNGTRGGGCTPNPVKAWFASNGILSSKEGRCLPPIVWTWDDETVFRFFSAVIDGDGSIYTQKRARTIVDAKRGPRSVRPAGCVSIHAGLSRDLADGYAALLRKVGVKSAVRQDKPGKASNWVVRIDTQGSVRTLLSGIVTRSKEGARLRALKAAMGRDERIVSRGCVKGRLSLLGKRTALTFDISTKAHHCFFANGYLVHNSGKDAIAMHWTACAAHERIGNYWHMLPEAAQARKAIWNAINPHTGKRRIDEAFPPALRAKTRDQEMMVEFQCGSTWQLVGSDNYDSLVGATPVGIVFSEWALADPQAWAFLRPILAENNGWALFITTPRGLNHAHAMFEAAKLAGDWYSERLPATDTSVFSPETLERERKELIDLFGEEEGDARFRQEYLVDFTAAMPGAYYGRLLQRAEDEGRITKVPHDPSSLVETWWDLGVGDSTAIWFVQRIGQALHVIDYYERGGVGLDHYAKTLKGFADERGYHYGEHILPHDARSREISSGETREQTLIRLGIRPTIQATIALTEKGYRADGIDQVRRILPRCWFDAERCKRGLEALRQYHRQWNDDRKMYDDVPHHDWSSHGADAFRVGAMHRPQSVRRTDQYEIVRPWDMLRG